MGAFLYISDFNSSCGCDLSSSGNTLTWNCTSLGNKSVLIVKDNNLAMLLSEPGRSSGSTPSRGTGTYDIACVESARTSEPFSTTIQER